MKKSENLHNTFKTVNLGLGKKIVKEVEATKEFMHTFSKFTTQKPVLNLRAIHAIQTEHDTFSLERLSVQQVWGKTGVLFRIWINLEGTKFKEILMTFKFKERVGARGHPDKSKRCWYKLI